MTSATPKTGKRFNWTRIHLIYFALAAFDLAAIGSGLWLSDRTNKQFQAAVASIDGGVVLQNHARHLHEVTTELTAPVNDLFVHGDVPRSRKALDTAVSRFREETSEEAFLEEIGKGTRFSGKLADQPESRDVRLLATVLGVSEEIATQFEDVEGEIRQAGVEIIQESEQAIAAYVTGDMANASQLLGVMNATAREQQLAVGRLVAMSNEHVRQVVDHSKLRVAGNVLFEMAIGGLVLLIIAMVLTYGHFVGRLLHRKYAELESAHAEADEANQLLQGVNSEVLRLNRELAENVRKLTAIQDESLRKGRLAQLGQLTATVAHELRNPLGAVRTSAFLLERKLKNRNLGVESQMQRIANGISRCDNIISQLLDFARTKSLQTETLVFDDWLASFLEEEASRLPATVSIECRLGLGGQKANFDPARMARVFVNLINNASEALVGKGDAPTKSIARHPTITISSQMTPRGVEISVSDNGPGISAEHIERIFEPLFTTKSFGTGLGIPAVQKILEQHGGGLDVVSAPGQGATFTAWWPGATRLEEAA